MSWSVPAVLKRHHYTEVRKIGEGSFGQALLVQNQDGRHWVCKTVDLSTATAKEKDDAEKEGKLLEKLKHPYIVEYHASFLDGGWFCLLMAYCEGGDLTQQVELAKKAKSLIPEAKVIRWMTQALLALKYIHSNYVLHRDLKTGNFFLTATQSVRMGDFGIAKVLSCTAKYARTQVGTPFYLSPEVCQDKPYAWPSDIWAMGCILYELCALQVPFTAPTIALLVYKICSGRIPSIQGGFSDFLPQLCKEMLNRSSKARPSAEAILQRPPMQDMIKELMKEAEAEAILSEGGQTGRAGFQLQEGDLVEYYSSTHGNWLQAVVLKAHQDGRVIIDLKPNTWLSVETQQQLLRPRRGDGCKLNLHKDTLEAETRVPSPAQPGERTRRQSPATPKGRDQRVSESHGPLDDKDLSRLCEELGIDDDEEHEEKDVIAAVQCSPAFGNRSFLSEAEAELFGGEEL